jgi:hypothetical protein
MGPIVYILSALTGAACALLLLRGYSKSRKKLLLWSGLCFAGLGVSSLLVFVDLILFPEKDLYFYRLATTTLSMALLLYGLIWEASNQ